MPNPKPKNNNKIFIVILLIGVLPFVFFAGQNFFENQSKDSVNSEKIQADEEPKEGDIGFEIEEIENQRVSNDLTQEDKFEYDYTDDLTELIVETIKPGRGSKVKVGDTIVVHYTGFLVDGTEFDSSHNRNQPFTTLIGVGQVILGWDEGMIGMQVEEVRKLVIPSDLGYGDVGAGESIPGGSTLIFEVELLEIL